MFTGLIEQTGTVLSLEERAGTLRLDIHAPGLASQLKEGDSVAVSGVCLTALSPRLDGFTADLAAETVARTSLTSLAPGSLVNLELPTPAGTPLGGHVVQGHVDGVGTVVSLEKVNALAPEEEADWWLTLTTPAETSPYMVSKGSVAIEGISLTIAYVLPQAIRIAILPLTYSRTNLHSLHIGSPVNLEADILLKYAESRNTANRSAGLHLTEEFLIANGF